MLRRTFVCNFLIGWTFDGRIVVSHVGYDGGKLLY
jgi:hypothetical protein